LDGQRGINETVAFYSTHGMQHSSIRYTLALQLLHHAHPNGAGVHTQTLGAGGFWHDDLALSLHSAN
jgi:hypothetical protein